MQVEKMAIESQRMQILSTLQGMVPAEELTKKVNEILEDELIHRCVKHISQLTNRWESNRAAKVATALAGMRTLTFHLEDQAAAERASLRLTEPKAADVSAEVVPDGD